VLTISKTAPKRYRPCASLVNDNTIAVNLHGPADLPGICNLTNVGFAAGSGQQFSIGTDPAAGNAFVQAATVDSGPTLTTLAIFNLADDADSNGSLIADSNGGLIGTPQGWGAGLGCWNNRWRCSLS
jgi:hypothetical protein